MSYTKEIELLKSLGFEIYDPNNELHYEPEIFIQFNELLFIDGGHSRNRIYVHLYDSHNNDVGFSVYVLNDIGCGAVLLPFRWAELSSDWLTHLKMAFDGVGFDNNKKNTNA